MNPFNVPETTSGELAAKIAAGELTLVTNPDSSDWIDGETRRYVTVRYIVTDLDQWSDTYVTPEGMRIHDANVAARESESRAAQERNHTEMEAEFARMRALGVVKQSWTSNQYDLSIAQAVLVPLRTKGGTYESDDGWDRIAMHDHLIPGLLVEQTGDVAKVFVTDARFSRYPDLHKDVREFVDIKADKLTKR